MAAYTRCLRCAGAPRRPASGSELSLHILSWHAVPCDPGESEHRQFQTAMSAWPSPRIDRLGNPNDPAIRFTREVNFGATWFTQLLRPARLLAPPVRIRPITRSAHGRDRDTARATLGQGLAVSAFHSGTATQSACRRLRGAFPAPRC